MRLLARFDGPNGEIRVMEERATGARSYCEGGVEQSRVLPGGEAGVAYIALMAQLLSRGDSALLLGCGDRRHTVVGQDGHRAKNRQQSQIFKRQTHAVT
jgi:hypothetical protein